MQINVEKIEFKNLFSYGNKWQTFEPNGICFITGLNLNNDRRNFTGKSNLLKVFPYSLFGKIEDLSKDKIINWKNGKNGECFVHIRKGNDIFVIHRGMKPDILEVTKNGKQLPQPANKKDFQKQIEDEILGVDFQTFMSVVYADTNNSSSILKMSKPNKRKFLENIFDLEYYTKQKDKANNKINAITQNIQLSEQSINQTLERIEDLKKDVQKYEKEYENVNDSSATLKQKNRKLKMSVDSVTKATKELGRIQTFVEELRQEKAEHEKAIFKLKSKAKELSRYIIKDADKIDVQSIKKKIEDKRKELSEQEEKTSYLNKELKSFDNNLLDAKSELNGKITFQKSKIKSLKDEIKSLQEKAENKIDDEICPTCFSKVDHSKIEDHFYKEIKNSNRQLSTTEEDLLELENDLKKIQEQLTEKKRIEDELSNAVDKGVNLAQQLDKLKKDLEDEKEKESKIEKSNKYRKVIKKMLQFKKMKENSSEKNDENREIYEQDIEANKKVISKYEQLETEVNQLKKDVEHEESERKRILQWKSEAENKIEELEQSINTKQKEIKKSYTTKDYLECIKVLCGDERAKKYTISNKIPLLNQRTNYYLSKAGTNFYVKLDNWLEVDIRGPGIKDAVYANLSGAEKVSLDRSLQFAFNDINKLQSPTYFDFLVLDEILDSSVDSIGLQNIVNIVKTKQEEDQSNVLIVSHKQSFDELEDLVDNFYRVEFDGRYSYINKI